MSPPVPLRDWLGPTLDHLAQQPDMRRLCRALAYADGFALQIVVCESPRAAAALTLWLTAAVAGERGTQVLSQRLSPYPHDPRIPGPDTLVDTTLDTLVLAPLHNPALGQLVFIDATRAGARDLPAWRALFPRLNEQRNTIARDLGAPLTLILPSSLATAFAHAAPDLWSIRGLSVTADDLHPGINAMPLVQAFERSTHDDSDVDALREQVARARADALTGDATALRSLCLLLLRLAGACLRTGANEAAAAIDEATALARRLHEDAALAACLLARSQILQRTGRLDQAQRLLESEVVPSFVRASDAWSIANARGRIADILDLRDQQAAALAIRLHEELPTYHQLGDVISYAATRGKIADSLQASGDLDAALQIRETEELPVYDKLGDVHARALTMMKIADVRALRGQLDEALRIYRDECLPVAERFADIRLQTALKGRIANIHSDRGELAEALRINLDEVLPIFQRLGDHRAWVTTVANLATILAHLGRYDEAIDLWTRDVIPAFARIAASRPLSTARTNLAAAQRARAGLVDPDATIKRTAESSRAMGLPDAATLRELIARTLPPTAS